MDQRKARISAVLFLNLSVKATYHKILEMQNFLDDIIYNTPGFELLYESRKIDVTPRAYEVLCMRNFKFLHLCCSYERSPSLIISTGITGVGLEVNLLICRLQFQANNAQLVTAIASSGPISETPQLSDLLICLCKR